MECLKQTECTSGLGIDRGRRKPSIAQQLADRGYSGLAPTKVESNLMNAVHIEHNERVARGWYRVVATVPWPVSKLYSQTKGFEWDRLEIFSCPSLGICVSGTHVVNHTV